MNDLKVQLEAAVIDLIHRAREPDTPLPDAAAALLAVAKICDMLEKQLKKSDEPAKAGTTMDGLRAAILESRLGTTSPVRSDQ